MKTTVSYLLKKAAFLLPFSFLLLFLSLAYASTGHAQSVTLSLAHYSETDHPAHLSALQFAKRVEQRTGGQVKIGIFPKNQLGSPPEQLRQIKRGDIDMGLPTQGGMDKFERAFAVVMMPYVFDSYDHAHRVLDGAAMEWLAPLAEKEGFVILSNWEYGFRHLTNSKHPINSPQDVRGLLVRVPPEIQLEAAMETLGGKVIHVAFPELVMALSNQSVDAQENPISVIASLKLHEVQKHLALTRHSYNSMMHVISTKSWSRLSPVQQQILREESRAAGLAMRKAVRDEEETLIARLQGQGMQVTRPEIKAFSVLMEPAYKKIGAYAGDANVTRFLTIVEQARKK